MNDAATYDNPSSALDGLGLRPPPSSEWELLDRFAANGMNAIHINKPFDSCTWWCFIGRGTNVEGITWWGVASDSDRAAAIRAAVAKAEAYCAERGIDIE